MINLVPPVRTIQWGYGWCQRSAGDCSGKRALPIADDISERHPLTKCEYKKRWKWPCLGDGNPVRHSDVEFAVIVQIAQLNGVAGVGVAIPTGIAATVIPPPGEPK